MDYVLVSDVARYYTVSAALWIIAVALRVVWNRWRAQGWRAFVGQQQPPHPVTYLGLCVLLAVAIARRFEHLGQPGDVYLWAVFTGVTLVLVGVLINIRFTLTPPWKRH